MTSWNNQNKSSSVTWSVEAKNASSLSLENKGDDNVSLYDKDALYDKYQTYEGYLLTNWSLTNKN